MEKDKKKDKENRKMDRKECQERIEQVRQAVLWDLTDLDTERAILTVRLWCRDDEDRFDLCCHYDFSSYMDMLFRRFEPDVKEWINKQYTDLKEWFLSGEDKCKSIYDEISGNSMRRKSTGEEVCDKYYVTVTKYVEIGRNMTILYSTDFSLKGEILAIGDPTGYYRGFDDYREKGYVLSKTEKIISDKIRLSGEELLLKI